MFLLIMYLIDYFFSSLSFFQLVSTMLNFIITYVSPVSLLLLALCHLPILALASLLSSLYGPLHYFLISSMSILISVLLLGLFLTSCLTYVLLFNLTYSIFCYCLHFMASSLVFLLLLHLPCAYFLVPSSCVILQFTFWYFLLLLDLCGIFSCLRVACQFALCAFLGICVIFTMGRSSMDVSFPYTPHI